MDVNNIQFTKMEIRIAKYLFKHYKDKYNPRQLARRLETNHAHANKLCNLLTEKGLLVKEELGNAVYFSYHYKGALAIKFMEYLLSLEEKEFPPWLTVLLHSLNKFKPHIQLGLVFGSSIKTEHFHDIDVLLLYHPDTAKEVTKVKEDIRKSGLIEQPIRYVEVTEEDVLLNKEQEAFYNMLSGSLIFHNPGKYIEVIKKCRK